MLASTSAAAATRALLRATGSSRVNVPSIAPTAAAALRYSQRNLATKPPHPETPEQTAAAEALRAAAEAELARAQAEAEAQAAAGSSSSSSSSAKNVDPNAPPSQSTPSPNTRSTGVFDIDTSLAAIAEEAAEGSDGGKGGRTGARARSERAQSSIEQSRKFWWRLGGLAISGIAGFEISQMGREFTVKERERHKDDPAADSALGRIKLRLKSMYQDFNAPVWEELLPAPLPFPYQRPYTLVVDLDDLLVHSHWTREHGWRTAKRPGLDYFLGYLSQFYEIVIYTSHPFYAVGPIIEKIDPDRRKITYTLFRESCRTLPDGKLVKDLDRLNRDLSKVLVLDTNPDHFSLHPGNGFTVKKWTGNPADRELLELVPFLEAIGVYGIPDVRQTLAAYAGKELPAEFNRKQREVKQQELADWQAKHGGAAGAALGGGGAGGLGAKIKGWLGANTTGNGGAAGGNNNGGGGPPKTFLELESDRYHQGYAEDEKFWRENGPALRQQAKDEQEKAMKDMKLSVWDMLSGKQFQPPAGPAEGGSGQAQPQAQQA